MSTSHEDLQRSLGRVEGNQSQLEARMDRFEKLVSDGFKELNDGITAWRNETSEEMAELRKEVSDLKDKETERRGAWKVIVAVAGAVSAVVAALIKYLTA